MIGVSARDVAHFRTFGFLVLRGYLAAGELDAINAEVDAAMQEAYRETPFDGSARHWVPLLSTKTPFVASLVEDPRFCDVAEQLLGAPVVLWMADANRYVGDTGWHPDGEPSGQGVKFVHYLEPLTAATGAVRVIPGSHREPFHSQIKRYFDGDERRGEPKGAFDPVVGSRTAPGYVFASEPGDVIAWNHPLWHASFGGSDDRRMCTIGFLKLSDQQDAARARDRATGIAKGALTAFKRVGYPMYDPEWRSNPGKVPKRRALIERMEETGMFAAAEAGERAT